MWVGGHFKCKIRNAFFKNREKERLIWKLHSWEQSFHGYPPGEMRAVWKVHFKRNGILSLLWERSLSICWVGISFTASLASKVLVLGEQASSFLNAGGKRLLGSSGWWGFAGGAAGRGFCRPLRERWEKPALQSCSAVFWESCPSQEGRERKGAEVKCTLHLGYRFSILLLEILKIPWNSPWRE